MNDYEFSPAFEELIRRGSVLGSQLHATMTEAWDNGYIPIDTWTLPSGNVPNLTIIPASDFIRTLSNYHLPGLPVDKLTTGVREGVATEGDRLHKVLPSALAYALVNHSEKAADWWLSVGIVSQSILATGGEVQLQHIRALTHPSWDFEPAIDWHIPAEVVEQAEGAECGTGPSVTTGPSLMPGCSHDAEGEG